MRGKEINPRLFFLIFFLEKTDTKNKFPLFPLLASIGLLIDGEQ